MWRRFLVGIQGSRLRRKLRETYKVARALNIIKNGWQDAEKQSKNMNRLRKKQVKNLVGGPGGGFGGPGGGFGGPGGGFSNGKSNGKVSGPPFLEN